MPIIGADDQVVRAAVLEDVIEIIRTLTGDIHIVGLQRIVRKYPILALEAQIEVIIGIGQPLRAHLDEAPAQFGKLLRDLVHQQIVEGAYDGEFGPAEASFRGIDVAHGKTVVAGMKADRKVEFLRHLIEPEEIRTGEPHLQFQASDEDTAGAVLLAEGEFLARRVHGAQGRHHGPAQAALALFPDIGEPAIVAAAERDFDRGILSPGAQEHRRVEHLDVDIERVHVIETRLDVAHLAGHIGGVGADIVLLGLEPPIDDPELPLDAAFIAFRMLALDLADDPRFEMAKFRVDIVECGHRLDDVGIGINGSHYVPQADGVCKTIAAISGGAQWWACPWRTTCAPWQLRNGSREPLAYGLRMDCRNARSLGLMPTANPAT